MIRRPLLLVALLLSLPAAAQIYSWKDKDGRVHYSDTPPLTGEVSVVQGTRAPRPAAATAADSPAADGASETAGAPKGPPTLAEREQAFRERRAAEAEAAAKAEEAAARDAERARFCEQARNQLTALQSGQRVSRFNATGEREYLDDAARNAEAQRLQQQISEHCN
ncbi:DUF4124 domain-containing protein [Thauera sp. ZXT1-4]|uniref:DUF4124 domain-containing protein n=1 Tax=Thauera sp. ZXT1-4 TaxID=3460294 RepID=UPI004040BBFB